MSDTDASVEETRVPLKLVLNDLQDYSMFKSSGK